MENCILVLFRRQASQYLGKYFRILEVTSDAVPQVMAVYWGCEAMTLIVCRDCTCVAAGSPVIHAFSACSTRERRLNAREMKFGLSTRHFWR